MAKRIFFPRLCSLIRQIVMTVLYTISFLVTWYTCYKLNKKTQTAKRNERVRAGCALKCNGKVSVIIPLKNEARYIGKTILNLESTTVDKSRVEIILVDSGCKDNTLDMARVSKGVIPVSEIKFCPSNGSRGAAFNAGAELAAGDILLFLRADCLVPPGYDETLRRQLSDCGSANTVLSAFRFDFDAPSTTLSKSLAFSLRIISVYQNMMSSICKFPKGSQALAVTSSVFKQNKFATDLLLMEDIEYVDRLRQYCAAVGGEVTILEQAVRSSSDDIVAIGALKSSLFSILAFISWYHFGMSEEFVHKWFYVRIPRVLSFYKL